MRFSFALCGALLLTTHVARADQKAVELLNKVQKATEAAKTLTADFTDTTVTPADTENITSHMMGTLRLMKPNYADISLTASIDIVSHFREHIVSDGTLLWTYTPATNLYTKKAADPEGKNINVWQMIIIGGFFSVPTWIQRGLYADTPTELTYAGQETVNGIEYQVLEHKLTRSIHDKPCSLDQKLYIGTDNLIHRFTLCLTQDGKSTSEVAELTNIKVGQTMLPTEFTFAIPAEAQQRKTQTVIFSSIDRTLHIIPKRSIASKGLSDHMHLLQILGLLAAIPLGYAMFFASYTLFKKKRKREVIWSVAIALALTMVSVAYLFDQTHRYTMLFNLTGILGFSFGKSKALEKHPEAFYPPKKEEK